MRGLHEQRNNETFVGYPQYLQPSLSRSVAKSQEGVVEIGSSEEHVVEGNAKVLGAGVEGQPDQIRFLWMVEPKPWEITAFIIFSQWWC